MLLPVAGGIAFAWMRRPGARWQPTAVAVLASVYVVVLGVAWWAMSAKVPT